MQQRPTRPDHSCCRCHKFKGRGNTRWRKCVCQNQRESQQGCDTDPLRLKLASGSVQNKGHSCWVCSLCPCLSLQTLQQDDPDLYLLRFITCHEESSEVRMWAEHCSHTWAVSNELHFSSLLRIEMQMGILCFLVEKCQRSPTGCWSVPSPL